WEEGTEELHDKPLEELAAMLGLKTAHVPGMAEKENSASLYDAWSSEGMAALNSDEAVPLRLFIHQWQGLVKLVHNMMNHRNTLIMDAVGVGKTAQAIATILMYEWIRQMQAAGTLPEVYKKMSAGKEPLPDRPHVIVVPPGLVSQWQMELHRFLPPRSFMILPYLG
ncbi:hypothetical protein C8T65DRAFT_537446, partial [Cerioporus squamosus]